MKIRHGIVEGKDFYLSSFMGSVPGYYKGSFTADGQLSGENIGARGGQHFTGALNPAAALPDPYKLTYLKEGYTAFDFSFPDLDGKLIAAAAELQIISGRYMAMRATLTEEQWEHCHYLH